MMYIFDNTKEGNPLEQIQDDLFMLKIPTIKQGIEIYEFAGPFFETSTAKAFMEREGLPSDTVIAPITEKYLEENITIVDNPTKRNFLN